MLAYYDTKQHKATQSNTKQHKATQHTCLFTFSHYKMVYPFCATIFVHPHAMGHVIGRHGRIINRIRRECSVVTFNKKYSEHQNKPVRITIKGYSRNSIQQAIFQIDHQVAISNEWCRTNGISY